MIFPQPSSVLSVAISTSIHLLPPACRPATAGLYCRSPKCPPCVVVARKAHVLKAALRCGWVIMSATALATTRRAALTGETVPERGTLWAWLVFSKLQLAMRTSQEAIAGGWTRLPALQVTPLPPVIFLDMGTYWRVKMSQAAGTVQISAAAIRLAGRMSAHLLKISAI
jgi:hypothetical protein